MKAAITAKHFDLDPELTRYITKKLDKLDRYISRHARDSVHAEVVLRELPGKPSNRFECEFILHLPHAPIIAKEATINMFAAIDIVEAKIRNQLLKYKAKAEDHTAWHSRAWRRLSGGDSR